MGRLIQIASSTLLSGGILGNGSIGSYISNSARLAMGMGLAELQDGQVHYFSKHHDLLKRASGTNNLTNGLRIVAFISQIP